WASCSLRMSAGSGDRSTCTPATRPARPTPRRAPATPGRHDRSAGGSLAGPRPRIVSGRLTFGRRTPRTPIVVEPMRAAPTPRPLVALTFAPRDELRAAVQEALATDADVAVLDDLAGPARTEALGRARALLSWQPSGELSPEELAGLGGLGLIQLLSAGTDRFPFDAIPPGVAVAGNVGAYAEPMAEHALAMALALAKRLPQKHADL